MKISSFLTKQLEMFGNSSEKSELIFFDTTFLVDVLRKDMDALS